MVTHLRVLSESYPKPTRQGFNGFLVLRTKVTSALGGLNLYWRFIKLYDMYELLVGTPVYVSYTIHAFPIHIQHVPLPTVKRLE